MPHLGVITDEISEDLDTALDLCEELGIAHIELRSVWNTSIVEHDNEAIRRIGEAIWERGMSVCAIASPFLKCHIDGDGAAAGRTHSASATTRADQWNILARSLEIAARLDTPIVRAFSFWRLDDPESVRDEILDVLGQATLRVKSAGLRLGLENEHACNIGSGQEARWYLERISDPTLGLIWDPGNSAALGVVPIPDDYAAVRDRIHHIHLKDALRLGEPAEFTTLGNGIIDYTAQFRMLAEDHYDGVLSLENHFTIDGSSDAATRANATAVRRLAADTGLTIAP
ncbi:MAG TPA: sugar phosphate isomerase/epimerase family protein [Thermomicrobiales bacterium]|nr:sugar phosphate isomerase/epimerase family protein [Thermomicrobiales bacterium]